MNLKNTVYSIIAGALIISSPAYALKQDDAQKATNFFSQAANCFSWQNVKTYAPVVGAFGGVYWCYSKYNQSKNLNRDNIEKITKEVNKRENINKKTDLVGKEIENQKNNIKTINSLNNKNLEALRNSLGPIINTLTFDVNVKQVETISEAQSKTKKRIATTLNRQRQNLYKTGILKGVVIGLQEQTQQNFLRNTGALHNINQDFQRAEKNLNQIDKNLNNISENIKPIKENIEQIPDNFEEQLNKTLELNNHNQQGENSTCRQENYLGQDIQNKIINAIKNS